MTGGTLWLAAPGGEGWQGDDVGRGKPTGPRQRSPIDVAQRSAARHCDRCKRRVGVLVQVSEPFGYFCPECVDKIDQAEPQPSPLK